MTSWHSTEHSAGNLHSSPSVRNISSPTIHRYIINFVRVVYKRLLNTNIKMIT